MANLGGKPGASVDESQSNSSSRRAQITTMVCKSSKVRCSECEIMFQPKMGECQPKLCADCMKGKPHAIKSVDHIYLGKGSSQNMNAAAIQVSAQGSNTKPTNVTSEIISHDSNPGIKRSMFLSSQKPADNSNKRKRLLEGNNSNSKESKTSGGSTNQPLTIVEILSSDDEGNDNKKQRAKEGGSGIKFPLPKIINVKVERVSDNEIGKNVIATKSAQNVVQKDVSNSNASSGQNQPLIEPLAVSLIQPGQAARSIWSKNMSEDSFSPISVPAIQDSAHVSLEALRSRESELTQQIVSVSSDSSVNDLVFCLREKILELKRKRANVQETIASKEAAIKALDAECNRLLVVVDACKKERDGVDIFVKDADAVVERAKVSLNAIEEQFINAQVSLAEAKDDGLISLLRGALKVKERRYLAAKDEVTRSADLLKEAREDMQKAEEELKANETAYQKTLEQAEKERSEFLTLSDSRHNSTEDEIAYFDSQLINLAQSNKKKYQDIVELEEQLLDIQYMRQKNELQVKKKIMTRWVMS